MMAVLMNRIYLEVTPEYKEKLREILTYSIESRIPNEPPLIIRNLKQVKGSIVSIPSGREDLIPDGYDIIDKRSAPAAQFPAFRGQLRESQQAVYDEIESSTMLNAWVSFGKTFTALAIAGKFSLKTLVVTHNVSIRTQWVRETEKVYGFTPGIIGSGKFDISTPIVVGNTQTLVNKIDKLKDTFGLVILDECHHVSSPTFSSIIDKCNSRYKLGLSGTLERKDGKHVVFNDYFSSKVIRPPKENFMEPVVHIYNAPFSLLDGANVPWAKKVNKVLLNTQYQQFVALLAAKYVGKGHKVLVVSDRTEFSHNCTKLVGNRAIAITGELKDPAEREKQLKRIYDDIDIIFGTMSIFSEGISENILSCLILATPINNEPLLTQLTGRIIREYPNKPQPVVVDINLIGNIAKNQATQRTGVYLKNSWKMCAGNKK